MPALMQAPPSGDRTECGTVRHRNCQNITVRDARARESGKKVTAVSETPVVIMLDVLDVFVLDSWFLVTWALLS
jgi:hypothetical protein